jgi:AraC-like DNA-binding protein
LAPHSGVLGFSVLAKEFERERTGRRGCIGTGRMGHDGVRDGAVSGRSRIGVQYFLAQSVRYAVTLGSAAANTRARGLVAPPQRQGGQAQFIERLMPDASGDQLGHLRDWMLENLARPLDLGTLATRAHLSRRTLSRRFREETGVSLMAWLADARIDRAREILETTTEPVENIGRLTGLGAPVSVRAAFHRRIGISPKEYRAVWRGSSVSATDSARAATSSSA